MEIKKDKTNLEIINEIQNKVENYLTKYHINSLIIGISGGFDSGFNAAILRPICDKLGIPLIGRYIHIDSNKPEERQRADMIGSSFCTDYNVIDMTHEYKSLASVMMGIEGIPTWEYDGHLAKFNLTPLNYKIALGNIKCRMRMIYLYNLAALYKGIVVDNDNKTEHDQGFWTIGGDIGDVRPLGQFTKTELYEIAKSYLKTLPTTKEKEALQSVIDAIPTDGLGISNSDVEQLGVDSYEELDKILEKIHSLKLNPEDNNCPFTDIKEINVWTRWKNSEFKRNHPYIVRIKGV